MVEWFKCSTIFFKSETVAFNLIFVWCNVHKVKRLKLIKQVLKKRLFHLIQFYMMEYAERIELGWKVYCFMAYSGCASCFWKVTK